MTLPAQITDLVATGGIEQTNLTWTPPVANPAITGYDIELKLNSSSIWLRFIGTGLTVDIDIFALTNALYDFRVRAINADGVGPFSDIKTATPTLISVPLAGLFNENSVDTNNPVAFWNNQGTKGSDWDLDTPFGTVANLTPGTVKGKAIVQSSGVTGLQTSVTNPLVQPYTIITVAEPTTLDANKNILVRDSISGGITDQTISNALGNLFAGNDLPIAVTIPTDQELIIIGNYQAPPNANVRVILNDGSTDVNASGNAGNNNFELDTVMWQSNQAANRDYKGKLPEIRVYDGNLSVDETYAVIGAYQQKWWDGFPEIASIPVSAFTKAGKLSVSIGINL